MLFRPTDIASLVFFRLVFGILGFADLMGVWTYYHLYKGYFDPEKFHFHYLGFEWVRPLPEPLMSLFFIGLMVAAICIVVGWRYRICTVIFALGFTWIFLMEKALYLNHGYLFCWISFLMIALPAHRNWSLDVIRQPSLRLETIERWQLWALPFLMGVVYFYGGIAKINPDWLNANPLHSWLKNASDMPLLGWLWKQKITAYVMAWSGMLLDISAPFLLLFRKTRGWALGFILLFHLVNTLIFQIGIFPWLSIALSLLFFPPDLPRRWFGFLKEKFRKMERLEAWWESKFMMESEDLVRKNFEKISPHQIIPIKIMLSLLVAVHLLVPLRHHLFEGDVAWTEEGHRYAWRMMLRSKQGYGYFTIKNTATGEESKIKPEDYLTDRQFEKVFTHPDMILEFAHYLRDLWKRRGVPETEVRATIRVKLNGRAAKPFVNDEIDLAKERWDWLRETRWIFRNAECGMRNAESVGVEVWWRFGVFPF